MTRLQHAKSNFLLAYPIMLGMLGQVMTGVADNVMVGWTGALPLAAASFGNTFYSILLFFCVGVSYAITPLVARAAGAGDVKEANEVLRHGLMINLTIGTLVTVLIFVSMPLMYHMGQPVEVVDMAIPYIGIIAPAIIKEIVNRKITTPDNHFLTSPNGCVPVTASRGINRTYGLPPPR